MKAAADKGIDPRDMVPMNFCFVGAPGVEPEDGRRVAEARAFDGELYPVQHRGVLGLAGPPDVSALHFGGPQPARETRRLDFRLRRVISANPGDFISPVG